MDPSAVEVLHTSLLVLLSVVTGGAVPWAFKVSNRLTRIETKLSNGLSTTITETDHRLTSLELRHARNHPTEAPTS